MDTENSQKTILVVEDEQSLLQAVKIKLSQEKYTVSSAKSIETAKGSLASQKIDAVWLDHYLMGSGSGLDLVHFMKKKDSPYKNIPIFVVSNSTSPEKERSYLTIGANKFYTKSNFKLAAIVEDITTYLEQHDKPN